MTVQGPNTLPPTNNPTLNILVVGAGLAGLTAAIALRRQGHLVTVYERSKFATEAGAGIHISPNGARMLGLLDMPLEDLGSAGLAGIKKYTSDEYQRDCVTRKKIPGAPSILTHRRTLHNALKDHATSENGSGTPVRIFFDSQLVNIDVDKPSITLSTGQEVISDVLLCADGVNSWTRPFIAPGHGPVAYGVRCFRWMLPHDEMKSDPKTAQYCAPGFMHEWRGFNRKLVSYPLQDHSLIYFTAFVPTGQAGASNLDWKTTCPKEDLVEAFKGFGPGVQHILSRVPESDLMCWQLQDMKELPTWAAGYSALIGDAAHPLLPFLGQGASMAIEDGLSLAAFLPFGTTKSQVPERLHLYEQCRKPHVHIIQDLTRQYGRELDDSPDSGKTLQQVMNIKHYFESHNEWEHSLNYLGCRKMCPDLAS